MENIAVECLSETRERVSDASLLVLFFLVSKDVDVDKKKERKLNSTEWSDFLLIFCFLGWRRCDNLIASWNIFILFWHRIDISSSFVHGIYLFSCFSFLSRVWFSSLRTKKNIKKKNAVGKKINYFMISMGSFIISACFLLCSFNDYYLFSFHFHRRHTRAHFISLPRFDKM